MLNLLFAFAVARAADPTPAPPPGPTPPPREILIMGHRGTAGHRPEHTRMSYELAAEMGADYIEPDLVMTKDKVLVARHENNIAETTDVEKKFPKRKKTKIVDGETITGYFTEDFTLKELKTLRAKERLEFRDHSNDGKDQILTFEEVIKIVRDMSHKLGRPIGIIPEIKHPTYFRSIKLDPVKPFVKILKKEKLDQTAIVQCFEFSTLVELHRQIRAPLYMLLDDAQAHPADLVAAHDPRTYGSFESPLGLSTLARIATFIGPPKQALVTKEGESTGLIELAHKAGLKVSPYTFRNEKQFIVPAVHGDPHAEYLLFYKLGVDGLFSDYVDDAVAARKEFLSEEPKAPTGKSTQAN